MTNDIVLLEYQAHRAEIVARVKILHSLITIAAIGWAIGIMAFFILLQNGVDRGSLQLFHYLVPLPFAALSFAYVGNLKVIRAHALYIEQHLKPKLPGALGWEGFFGSYIQRNYLATLINVFPLVLPLLMPFAALIIHKGFPTHPLTQTLALIDILFLLLTVTAYAQPEGE